MISRLSLQQFKGLFFVQSLFVLLLAATGRASANTIDIMKNTNYPIPSGAYFVSPDGKETNSGTNPASPWPVAKALASAPSGATIVFRGGIYRNIKDLKNPNGPNDDQPINIGKKLTLQPYPGEKALIKGSIEVKDSVADGNNIWRKDGWNYSFPPNMDSRAINPSYPMAGYRDMVYINGVSLKQVASKASVVAGTFYVDSVNKKLYIGDNPVGNLVEATALKEGFTMWTGGSSQPADTIIRGLGFEHYADQAISVAAPRVTLEDNTFVWNGVEGATFKGESAGIKGVSADAIVRGNTFRKNGMRGLGGDQVHRMLLSNNTISYNNVETFSRTWSAAGVKAINTDGLIWRDNLVEHNIATGMWADVSCTNATIVRNTVRHNQSIGIMFEISHKAIIAGNVAYNNHDGVMVSESSSARVYNNTLSKNRRDIVIKDDIRVNTNAAQIAAGITWIARNNIVKNNILSNTQEKALFDASNWGTKEPSVLMITASDYNAYYRTSSTMPKSVIRWSLGGNGWSSKHNYNNWEVGFPTVAAFNAETGYEAHALAIDNVATNPFFIDEANGDYRLKPGSPAIGRGEPLPPDIAAAIGLPSGVPVNLGAL